MVAVAMGVRGRWRVAGQRSRVSSSLHDVLPAQERVADLSNEVDDARAELEARLEKSKQFLSMRTMITKKNVVIQQLREQLKVSIACHGGVRACSVVGTPHR